jgi:hypothetical protein
MLQDLLEITYGTEVLPLETIREKIFRNTKELKKEGYEFHFIGDLDPKNPPKNTRGFGSLGSIITAAFERQELQFLISVSIEERTAWIYGESQIQESRYKEVEISLKKFEEFTGIQFNLEKLV